MLPVHDLPQVLDPGRVLADEQAAQVLDSAHNRTGVPLQCCLSPPDQPWFVGHHLDEDPIAHSCVADVRFDLLDPGHRRSLPIAWGCISWLSSLHSRLRVQAGRAQLFMCPPPSRRRRLPV